MSRSTPRPGHALEMLAEKDEGAVWQHPHAEQVTVQWGQVMLAMSPREFAAFQSMIASVRRRPAGIAVLPGGT